LFRAAAIFCGVRWTFASAVRVGDDALLGFGECLADRGEVVFRGRDRFDTF